MCVCWGGILFNSLGPIVDISLMEFPLAYGNLYGGFNTRRYTSVHGFCFFKLLFIGPKELRLYIIRTCYNIMYLYMIACVCVDMCSSVRNCTCAYL